MKQVIVVNEALKLPRGKLSAQVAHASIASFLTSTRELQQAWLDDGMPKVVLKVGSEDELISIQTAAQAAELPTQLIKDAGRTVIAAGTVTCLGIGPAHDADVNAITGALKLLS